MAKRTRRKKTAKKSKPKPFVPSPRPDIAPLVPGAGPKTPRLKKKQRKRR